VSTLPATAVTNMISCAFPGRTWSPTWKRVPLLTVTAVASWALGLKTVWLMVSVLGSSVSSSHS
jgi:hypothetical protein